MKGMLITEQILEELGAVKKTDGYYVLVQIYEFWFMKNEEHWTFGCPTGTFHSVTHLDECLSFVFQEGIEFGKQQKSKELKEILGEM